MTNRWPIRLTSECLIQGGCWVYGKSMIRSRWPLSQINAELKRPDGMIELHTDGAWYEVEGTEAVPFKRP